MAYVVCAKWIAKEGEADAVAAAIAKLAGPSRAEPGILQYQPHRDPENPNVFFFYEQYRTPTPTRRTSTPSTSRPTASATPSRGSRPASACSTRRGSRRGRRGGRRPREQRVDELLAGFLLDDDEALAAALRASAAAGLPPADVSPLQGRLLQLLARLAGARTILELGTLGRLQHDLARPRPAARRTPGQPGARAGLRRGGARERRSSRPRRPRRDPRRPGGRRPGPARRGGRRPVRRRVRRRRQALATPSTCGGALELSRPGTLIVVDNVVRGGAILDADADDPSVRGVHELLELVRDEPRLSATALQTVGAKGWDGLVLALVEAPAARAGPR